MKIVVTSFLLMLTLSACVMTSPVPNESDADIARRRAEIRAMDEEDYQISRRRRQDAIEDLGTMQMNEAKAVDKSYNNRSKRTVNILH